VRQEEFVKAIGIGSYYPLLLGRLVHATRTYQYSFMPIAEFERLTEVGERMRIYWFEILERAHFGAITALIRLERWLDAMRGAAESENFLGFASSVRGLVESAADTRYALGDVPRALAATFRYADGAVHGKATAVVLAPDLENDLIHFSHGRKLASGEEAPESHTARCMKEYLKALQGASTGPLHDCYAELCNITHPAAHSVLYLLEKKASGAISFRSDADDVAIRDLCARSRSVIAYAVSEAVTYPLVILRILNRFALPELRMVEAEEISLEHVRVWNEAEALLTKFS
jgi:hypothetical protein